MARSLKRYAILLLVYLNVFILGGVVMGLEMLSSRYLYPYFGGGIGTWAGLISTVLGALTVGYFGGGVIIDRYPSPFVIAAASGLAAAYLALVPMSADTVIAGILEAFGDGPGPILMASAALLLVPLSVLGMVTPIAIRLVIRSMHESGRIAGMVYGVSTIGSIFGTLFTTFVLIPAMGSRAITYLFAAILVACAASLPFAAAKDEG
jgi:hypothetical protein